MFRWLWLVELVAGAVLFGAGFGFGHVRGYHSGEADAVPGAFACGYIGFIPVGSVAVASAVQTDQADRDCLQRFGLPSDDMPSRAGLNH